MPKIRVFIIFIVSFEHKIARAQAYRKIFNDAQAGKTLGLLVDEDNPAAKRLYLNMGFVIVKPVYIFQKNMEHLQYSLAQHA